MKAYELVLSLYKSITYIQPDYPYNNMFRQKNNLTNGHIFATLCHVQNLYIVIELYSQSKKRNGVAQKMCAIWTTK